MAKKADFTKPANRFFEEMEEETEVQVIDPAILPGIEESKPKALDEPKKTTKKKATASAAKLNGAGADVSELQKLLDARKGDRKKETVCLTLRPSTRAALFKMAKKCGMSASELADYILADTLPLLK